MIKLQSPLSPQFRFDLNSRNSEFEQTSPKSHSLPKCSLPRTKTVTCQIKQPFSFEEYFQRVRLRPPSGLFPPRKYDEPVSLLQLSYLRDLSYCRVTTTFDKVVLTDTNQSCAEPECDISGNKPLGHENSKVSSNKISSTGGSVPCVDQTGESISNDQDFFDYEGPTDWDSDSTTISLPSSETFSVSSVEIETDDSQSDLKRLSSIAAYRSRCIGEKYRCSSSLRSKSQLSSSEESDIDDWPPLQDDETSRSYRRKYKDIPKLTASPALENSDTEEYEISDDDSELHSQSQEYEETRSRKFCTEQSSNGTIVNYCIIQPDSACVNSVSSPSSAISRKLEQLTANVEQCIKINNHFPVVKKRKKKLVKHFIQKKSRKQRSSASSRKWGAISSASSRD